MTIYHFDTFNGVERVRDDDGLEFPNRKSARDYAQALLPNLAEDYLPCGERSDFIVDVRDASGILIYTCMLSMTGRWLDHSVPPLENRAMASGI